MKKLSHADVLSASDRVSLKSSALAAEVLYVSELFLEAKAGELGSWKPRIWKGGILRIQVDNSAVAMKLFAQAEPLLQHLRQTFPDCRFREVRTEVGGGGR